MLSRRPLEVVGQVVGIKGKRKELRAGSCSSLFVLLVAACWFVSQAGSHCMNSHLRPPVVIIVQPAGE
jgi:hypothetical protein